MYTWTSQQILCLDKKMNFFRKVTRFQHSFFVAHPFCTIVINRSDISFLMKPCNLKPFAINWSDITNSVHVAHLCPMSLRHPQLDSLLGSELRSIFFCASLFFQLWLFILTKDRFCMVVFYCLLFLEVFPC